ncbi:hypothetical protein N7540_006086 [Penicillium herquei]|nr:hypothetical protein N7540_006086 [Penicillium herquei]
MEDAESDPDDRYCSFDTLWDIQSSEPEPDSDEDQTTYDFSTPKPKFLAHDIGMSILTRTTPQ